MPAIFEPCEPRRLFANLLFIRGADRSGGFIEATNDAQRTEHLADINNTSTASGNHGWGQLADALRDAGYTLTQIVEPLEAGAPSSGQTQGAPIRFEQMDLDAYDAIVFGSNNASYTKKQLVAIDDYVRGGGGALFISDGNFGSDWADAPSSDAPFLRRFGMEVMQDDGTYALDRATHFADDPHPIFNGVDEIDGEGVSPLREAATRSDGVSVRRLIRARNNTVTNNGTPGVNQSRGTARPTDGKDGTLIVATVDDGRVAGHFDRNTFFNGNGAGTDLTRLDNRQYALNLFAWLTDNEAPGLQSSSYGVEDDRRTIRLTFNDNLGNSLVKADVKIRNRATGALLARTDYSFSVTHTDTRTTMTLRLRGRVDAGDYRVEVRELGVTDAAGNRRRSAIRVNFMAE